MLQLKKLFVEPYAHRLLAAGFFLLFLVLGLSIYGDYGISCDEKTSRDRNGLPNYQFIAHGDYQAVKGTCEKYHGPAFEILLLFVEKGLGLVDPRDIYLVRHLVTFLLFFAAALVFYRLLSKRFHNRVVGLVGALFLILSPRIFAEAFYNSKDLAFLCCFIFALATLDRFLRKTNYCNAVLHAAVCGFTMDIRNLAMILPIITVSLVVAIRRFALQAPPADALPRKPLRVYLTGLCCFTTLFWPVLWFNPPYHFYRAWVEMSRYPWPHTVLYLGESVKATDLPWHYIPVWLLITTPLAYSFFFLIGTGRLLGEVWQAPRRLLTDRPLDVAMALGLLMPVAAVIVLHSVVYDGWRHLYFIYPAFLFFAVLGFATLYESVSKLPFRFPFAKGLVLAAVAIPLAATAITMVQMHPHQYVYFNRLAGRDLKEIEDRFEMDYWGVSYRTGLENLVEHDPAPQIRVYAPSERARDNAMILQKQQRDRIVFTSRIEDADYLVTQFCGQFGSAKGDAVPERDFHGVWLNGAQLMAVQKVR